jgi:hypothetical protein
MERYNLTEERDEFDLTSLRTNEDAITEEILTLLRANEGNPDASASALQDTGPNTLQ